MADEKETKELQVKPKKLRVVTSDDFSFVLLNWASQRRELGRWDALTSLVAHFNVSDEALKERTANGPALRLYDRAMRAVSNLKNAGYWNGKNWNFIKSRTPAGRSSHARVER